MKLLLILLFLFSLSQSFIVPHLGNPQPVPPKIFKLQLNDPPELRWVHIVQEFIPRARKFVLLLTEWLPVPEFVYELVGFWGENIFPYKDIVLEIKGMAKTADLPFNKVFFLQFFYEFMKFKQCSSVVLRDQENKIQHGRNWDFPLFTFFSRLSATVEFYRGEKYIFTAEAVMGSSLVLTGVKNGEYAITINARTDTKLTFKDILYNLFVKNYIPPDFFLRIVFEQAQNFNEAVQMLNNTPIATAVYYIASGKSGNEGVVIERDAESIHGFYQLNETTWFLVQTNYDRNVPEPIHDPRRIPAEKRLEKIGQSITVDQLDSQIMHKWPSFNLATILTFMAVPSNSFRNTSLWYGRNGGPYQKQHLLQDWEIELEK